MLERGLARKVTIYLNEDVSSDRTFTYEQVFQFLFDQGVAGATLIRPQEGFGGHHHRHDQDGQGVVRRHLPVQIGFIESPEKVETLLPELCAMVRDGLIEMHDTAVVKAAKQEASF
jgi:PII-like signaling protein